MARNTVRLSCECGWVAKCRKPNVRQRANEHRRHERGRVTRPAVLADIEDRRCPLCRRLGALTTGYVGGEGVRYCRWARSGLCAWPGPLPEPWVAPSTPVKRTDSEWEPRPRPPWRPPEDQEEAIAWMLKLRDDGVSLWRITRRLDAMGLKPPMRGGRGGRWNAQTVRRYLAWADGQPLRQWYQDRR